jgi:GT2 family glycosyltransferase
MRSGKTGAVCHDRRVQPDVSVVVVNYHSDELALRAFADAAAAAPGLELEEILVENGSGEASVNRLAEGRPQARMVVVEENRGYGHGANAGLRAATGRTILLLNSDAFAHGDAVTRLVGYLDAHPRAGFVAPALLNEDGTRQLNAYRRFPNVVSVFFDYAHPVAAPLYGTAWHPYVLGRDRYTEPGRIGHAMGAALLLRPEVLDAAGFLDERYYLYLEETDWQRRASEAGWEVHLDPRAVFTHVGGGSTGDYSFASPHYLESLDRYFGGRRSIRAAAVAGSAITLAGASVAGRLRPADPRFPPLADAARRALAGLR